MALPPIPQPSPSLTPFSTGVQSRPEEQVKVEWRIVGKVGSKVAIARIDSDKAGNRMVVDDGDEWEGCLVLYPNFICDKKAMAAAKKKAAETVLSRRENEEKLARQRREAEIAKVRQAEETKLASQKARYEELQKASERMQRELEVLKAAQSTPPDWVRGKGKSFKDNVLGKVTIRREGDEIIFQVENSNEDSADRLFGKNVHRKETKGEYTYYALKANTVKFKEPL